MDEYCISLIKPLLSKPEELSIVESKDEMGILLTVKVSPDDMGQVIGRAGDTAKAIRHLVRVEGSRRQARISVKILEPDGSTHRKKALNTAINNYTASNTISETI